MADDSTSDWAKYKRKPAAERDEMGFAEFQRRQRVGTHGPECWKWGHTHYECARREAECLRGIVSECATACGAACSTDCTLEFMAEVPKEIGLALGAAREERDRAERNRDMWKGQCERQADSLTHMRGQQGVLVGLLRECLGPLELSAALIESDDSEQMDELTEKVRAALGAIDSALSAKEARHG